MQSTHNLATAGHPANGVVINETTTTTTTTTAQPHHHHHHHHHQQHPVGAAPATLTQPGPTNSDGRAVLADPGATLSSPVVLGGQCECTRNGGRCDHGPGKCVCRGCTAAATSLNPGINIGMSTQQYTAPVGTSGLGGGAGEAGTGMAGVLNPTNTVGAPVRSAVQNCECVKNGGVCKCPEGQCSCANCKAGRQSKAATAASAPLAGSEYLNQRGENYTQSTTTTQTTALPVGANLAASQGPITDNSNVPYEPKDYTTGHAVTDKQYQSTTGNSRMA